MVTGATGFIGRVLTCELVEAGYETVALSRQCSKEGCAPHTKREMVGTAHPTIGNNIKVVQWDAVTPSGWATYADDAYAVVNLAGENLAAVRWTKKKMQRILNSRLKSTKAIVSAVESVKSKPQVIIQISAIGYYGDRGDEILSENSSAGVGFLPDVCRQLEQAIQPIEALGVRLITVRIAVVLGAGGGLISNMLPAFRFFVGGHPGNGRQWFSWIHIEDVAGAIRFLIENEKLQGTFNLSVANPVLSKQFYKMLGKVMHRPSIFPMPAFILKLIMGKMANEMLLCSQRVLPIKLLQAGYRFKYLDVECALEDIIKKAITGCKAAG